LTAPEAIIAEKLQAKFDTLTRAERQLANSLLDSYPVSAWTTIAQSARVYVDMQLLAGHFH
jgi:DNA-binding MurR/RpiR family transcriptional regulator